MAITSRQGLIDYALRRLGKPVINIEVDDTQVQDRVDDAMQFFQEYHSESIERTYEKHQITANHLRLTTDVGGAFVKNETIIGAISGAKCIVWDSPEPNKVRAKRFIGAFVEGEAITGSLSGTTGIIMTGGIFIGDIQNQYIIVPDLITHITSILPIQTGNNLNDVFSMQYQIRVNELSNISSVQMQYYGAVQQHLALIENMLIAAPKFDFKRKDNKVTINVDWINGVTPDSFFVFEVFRILDPTMVNKIYDDMFLKKYVTSLIKRQWGENLSKYDEILLVGGVKMSGDKIYLQAIEEIKELEDTIQQKFGQLPMGGWA